jgi:hypothetical protein
MTRNDILDSCILALRALGEATIRLAVWLSIYKEKILMDAAPRSGVQPDVR